ncbi:MATE family efflux transporter DinF [Photobacterium aphoticum]|uniref:Multidrug resistance protein NorM n=1 Tax=Photobacterium aphoticum TaxID=754436 RepID=A0A0J1GPA5_9GAMM|nr:MATE family efflux transporter DinF [Photobacterium aphoticum]KLV01590.1 multidrug transporter MatE [Photobacterium aphoticum]PSU47423.1 MATE family efflux transporter [Photobacterium aphoticum]GHA43638.1 MATE family efflux transporter [Photobacterium aphoticum]
MFKALRDMSLHRQVFALALPMVLSNITVPLLGLVDAAVIGHLDYAWYLGGVAVGGTMINVTFWLLGFLRMATTGLSAQAYGASDKDAQASVFLQGLAMAWLLALLLIVFHQPVASLIFQFSSASAEVKVYAEQYFSIRIWGAPAALGNLVIMGWLLGTQNARHPMWLLIITNVVNIALDVLFVIGFGWKVQGAAAASVLAEYSGLMLGLWFVSRQWLAAALPSVREKIGTVRNGMGRLLRLNRDIFLRSLCLQLSFTFMTFQGATLGDDVVAANAVLMSFLMLVSYAMDGFAYAMEAMVGKAIGARNREALGRSLIGTTFWSLIISLAIMVAFAGFGRDIIGLISNIPAVQAEAAKYLPWLSAVPLVAMWCFLLDGIFIGATRGREMRNSMFVAICVFFAVWWGLSAYGNHALWAAMLAFMGMRGLGLAVIFAYQWHKDIFLEAASANN